MFLDDDWLTPDEREFKARALTLQDIVRTTFEPPPTAVTRPTPPTSTTIASTIAPTTSGSVPSPTQAPTLATDSTVSTTSIERELSSLQITAPPTPLIPTPASVVPPSPGVRRSTRSNKGVSKPRYIDEAYLSMLDDNLDSESHQVQLAYLSELLTCMDTGIVDICDPRVYAAKIS